jgi:gluconokinase
MSGALFVFGYLLSHFFPTFKHKPKSITQTIFEITMGKVPSNDSYLIGIDIGTGSIKAISSDIHGTPSAIARYPYPLDQPRPGFFEQDPEVIWKAFILSVRHLVSERPGKPLAIGLSSAMHSLILVDENGVPLFPMITWADVRSEEIARRIMESPEGEQIYRVTGTPIHPMSPLCKLIWLKENQNGLFKKAHKFISIKEYIWHKLFACFEIDYSIASGTGLFDIKTLNWSAEACALAGISPSQLSVPVDTTYTRNCLTEQAAELLGLPINTLFVIGASDGCCANLGSGVLTPGTAAITIGTSGAVRITGPTPVYNYPGMTFNYLLNKDTFVSGGAINNGGIAVDWLLKNFLGDPGGYQKLFDTIAPMPAGSDGLIFLPYLYGERAPIWDAQSSGAYLNIRPKHTRPHFLRAALEGICYTLYTVLQGLEQASGSVEQIHVSGGFTSSPVWMQILADVTGKRLLLLPLEDASAAGAVYLAMTALSPASPAPLPGKGTILQPNEDNHLVYARFFPLFKKLYTDLKDSMHAFNQINKKQ